MKGVTKPLCAPTRVLAFVASKKAISRASVETLRAPPLGACGPSRRCSRRRRGRCSRAISCFPGESWSDALAPEFSVAPLALVPPAESASVHLTAEDVSSSPSTTSSESCSQSVLPAPLPQSQGSSFSSSYMEYVSVDPSPIPWTVVTNRRKRSKAPLEFNNVSCKESGKKARVVTNAGASGNVIKEKEKKKRRKKRK